MKKILLQAVVLLLTSIGYAQSDITPVNLRVEYKTNAFTDVEKPRFSWELISKENDQVQTAWELIVASSQQILQSGKGDIWSSGKMNNNITNQVEYNGKPLSSNKTYYWKIRSWDKKSIAGKWSDAAYWSTGLMQQTDWKASWIGYDLNAESVNKTYHLPPAAYMRKEAGISNEIKKANLYISSLGLYEFYINGKRIGDDYFAPGWTDYNKRVYYNAYNVTHEIKKGKNTFGATVATGWYAGYLGYALLVGSSTTHGFYGKVPLLKAQIEVEYKDGRKETIVTDATWKASSGAIREADILNGETYDARLEFNDWSKPGFDDAKWQQVQVEYNKNAILQLYPGNPVKVIEELKALSITENKGKYVVDLGQNFSGLIRFTLKGDKGDSVILKYGEMLHTDGRVVTENLRRARATDTYIFKGGDGPETWMPSFTYHGFRYVELSGLKQKPGVDDIKGIVLSSATPTSGSFETDNAMLNQLYKNIVWTQRSNYFDIPTDCPQRDERLGWTGDAQVYMRSAAFNNDIAAFHTKWVRDLNDAQWSNGAYPVYAPIPSENGVATIRKSDTYSPGWAEAGIVCPYNIYKMYGDRRIVKEAWSYMEKYMHFLETRSKGKYVFPEAGFEEIEPKGGFGDWLSVGKKTPPDMLATMYYNYCALLMAEMANGIGDKKSADKYKMISNKIKQAFAAHYIDADGKLKTNTAAYGDGRGYVDGSLGFSGHTQTAYANAIYMQILSEENLARAGAYLTELIAQNNNQLSTGFLGFKPLLPALSATHNSEFAYMLLKDTAYPSLGFEVVNGATTIWERWDSYIKGEGFRHNASMNSFNHYAFGAVCEWMFQNMAGIQPADAGFRTFIISPEIAPSGIKYVNAAYRSINGEIKTSWKKDIYHRQLHLRVAIPVNTHAEVILPATSVENIIFNGKPINEFAQVKVYKRDKGFSINLGSGEYKFIINE
ncbi:MAG: family 78 glycoside hydrolase catalytic domain [Agriterribacter sp.]